MACAIHHPDEEEDLAMADQRLITESQVRERAGEDVDLERGAVGIGTVLMQSITHVAPAIAILLTVQFVVLTAGPPAPLVYIFAGVIILIIALNFTGLGRVFPS